MLPCSRSQSLILAPPSNVSAPPRRFIGVVAAQIVLIGTQGACRFDEGGLTELADSQRQQDVSVAIDGASPLDAAREGSTQDVPGDTRVGENAGIDAGAADLAVDSIVDLPSGPPSCQLLYGNAVGYVACWQTDTVCAFNALLDRRRSCAFICGDFGGACVGGFSSPSSDLCASQQAVSCSDEDRLRAVCLCSRPPGVG